METPSFPTTPEHYSSAASLDGLENPTLAMIASEKVAAINPREHAATVRPIHNWKWFLACGSIYLSAFLYGLDTTIAANVQPAIVKSLGNVQKLSWIGSGFPLGSIAVILPLGYGYGLFEIKRLYLLSILMFEAGSALCGAAPTMDALIVGRIWAGAGGAGMYLGVLNYVAVFTTIREQSLYNGLTGLVWGLGTILGPVVGGGFAISSVTWRFAFYINLCLAAVMAPVMLIYLPNHQPQPDRSFMSKIREMDWLGVTLNAAIFATFTLATTFGGAQWAWSDYRFIVITIFFGIILIAFIITQYFAVFTTKERRVFPAHFLRHRSLILLYVGTACSVTGLFVGTYFIPLFFQFAKSDTSIMAAVRLLPFVCIAITFIMLNGALMPAFGYYMPWYVVSGVFLVIGGSLMHTIDSNTGASKIYGYSVLVAIGAGSTLQSAYSIAAAKVLPQEIPAAIGFINHAQLGSIVIALSISGTVFQNTALSKLRTALAGSGFSEEEIASAVAGTQSAVFQHGSSAVKAAALKAIIQAMDNVFVLVIAAGALVLVSSIFMKREKLFLKIVAGG
jgi:MFS family permease